jgi:hypothetical protein
MTNEIFLQLLIWPTEAGRPQLAGGQFAGG